MTLVHGHGNIHLRHESRLHAAYVKLTFSCADTEQDARRERFFRRLVLHHLLEGIMYTLDDWTDVKGHECFLDFLKTYAKVLWSGSSTQRHHLADPRIRNGNRRAASFIGAIDCKHAAGYDKVVGSKLGRAFNNYVQVLLQPGIQNAVVEDVQWLVQGILSVEMGPEESPAMEAQMSSVSPMEVMSNAEVDVDITLEEATAFAMEA